jgi:hypothetical protein
MVFGGNFIPDIGCVGSGLDEIRPTNNKPSPNSQVWIQPYGSGCGGIYTCFTSGSLVLTPTGNKSIEEIQVGDTVSTLDGDKKVHALENPCLGDRRLISINNSKFFFTEDHPIKTTEGFKAANYEMCNNNYSYIDLVGELSVGDCVVSKDGYETIKDIEFSGADFQTKLYDITIDDPHEFICEDFVFHNCSICPEPAFCFSGCSLPYDFTREFIDDRTGQVIDSMSIRITQSGCYPQRFLATKIRVRDGSCYTSAGRVDEMIPCLGKCCGEEGCSTSNVRRLCDSLGTLDSSATYDGPENCAYVQLSGYGACCPPFGKIGSAVGDCSWQPDQEACDDYWASEGLGPGRFFEGEDCVDNPCTFMGGACCYDDGTPCVETGVLQCGGTYYAGLSCADVIPFTCTG